MAGLLEDIVDIMEKVNAKAQKEERLVRAAVIITAIRAGDSVEVAEIKAAAAAADAGRKAKERAYLEIFQEIQAACNPQDGSNPSLATYFNRGTLDFAATHIAAKYGIPDNPDDLPEGVHTPVLSEAAQAKLTA